MGTEAEVKGHALQSYATPLQRERPDVWAKLERELAPGDRQFFAEPIYANVWYPRRRLAALLDAHDRVHADARAARRELGRLAAHHQVRFFYRLFLTFATPALVFRRASNLWSRQNSTGSFTVMEDGATHLVGELADRDLPAQVPDVIAGWSDAIIEMLGRRPRPTEWHLAAPGRWRFLVHWSE
ncbi:MAG: hypothetical protein KF729_05230 [Sandaracinaceae bacterium]|nr:hypothetical protein [Sandaracinaceae bacterium]